MKKYIVLIIALMFVAGCGKKSDNNESITTETSTVETESTTEESSEAYEESTISDVENDEDNIVEDESKNAGDNITKAANTGISENTKKGFEEGEAYSALVNLANNAGFDISYSNGSVLYRTYITDDTIDNVKSKDEVYRDKWEENCGLYEEFCSEAVRIIKNNNIENVNVVFEVVGKSDNQVYFRNENGSSIYDAYVN